MLGRLSLETEAPSTVSRLGTETAEDVVSISAPYQPPPGVHFRSPSAITPCSTAATERRAQRLFQRNDTRVAYGSLTTFTQGESDDLSRV